LKLLYRLSSVPAPVTPSFSSRPNLSANSLKSLVAVGFETGNFLEEKYVMNEIEKDSYSFMKPKFKGEIKKLQNKLEELQGVETNHGKYLSFGVNLIQNLSFYYENASLINKQKLIGSIFPENLIIENGECRTARENEVMLASRGF
jgi:hypothetical protein